MISYKSQLDVSIGNWSFCFDSGLGAECWMVVSPPCGYCLKASMTGPATLWIDESPITLCQRVRL